MNDILLPLAGIGTGFLILIFAKSEEMVEVGAMLAVFSALAFAMAVASLF